MKLINCYRHKRKRWLQCFALQMLKTGIFPLFKKRKNKKMETVPNTKKCEEYGKLNER